MYTTWFWVSIGSLIINFWLLIFIIYVFKKIKQMKSHIIYQLTGVKSVLYYFDEFVKYTQSIGFENYEVATNPVLVEIVNKIGVIRALISKLSGEKKVQLDIYSAANQQVVNSSTDNNAVMNYE